MNACCCGRLAAELGLSVMPVRDAIRMLEGDGLVRTESHRGTSVAPIDPETVVELIGIRMWLEVLAVIEAAPPHTPQSLCASSTSGWRRPEAAVHGDALVYARANRALHAAIERARVGPQLKSMMSDLFDRGWQARRGSSVYTLVPDTSRTGPSWAPWQSCGRSTPAMPGSRAR